jgi:hypothetical protein
MASNQDLWFIRLPDGRVLRARSTEAMRRFLSSGQIPWDSRVRRSPDDPWQTLDGTREFADLVPREAAPKIELNIPATGATKSHATGDLHTLGLRGLVDELFNAFDSSLQRAKLITSACTGLGIGITLLAATALMPLLGPGWHWAGFIGAGLALLVLFSVCTSILTQLTALELSRYRPAQFSEIRGTVALHALRLTCALGLVGGLIVGLIVLLRSMPGWITPADEASEQASEILLTVVTAVRLILEVLCWPVLGIATLLMGPILIVEEYSVIQALRDWLRMVRQHLGRIYLYQAIAFAFALVMTMPLLMPILLAFSSVESGPRWLTLTESVPFFLLLGVALTPMLNYLLVAHVFIYLNLRYEFFYSARER